MYFLEILIGKRYNLRFIPHVRVSKKTLLKASYFLWQKSSILKPTVVK